MKKASGNDVRLRLAPTAYREMRCRVLKRDGWHCQICGRMQNLEVHHIRHRSRSGPDTEGNLITLCSDCHQHGHGMFGGWLFRDRDNRISLHCYEGAEALYSAASRQQRTDWRSGRFTPQVELTVDLHDKVGPVLIAPLRLEPLHSLLDQRRYPPIDARPPRSMHEDPSPQRLTGSHVTRERGADPVPDLTLPPFAEPVV